MKRLLLVTGIAIIAGSTLGYAIGQHSSSQVKAATATNQGGPMTYTNKPVTPGDPASYVGTVGQCPFYEIAGDKGCFPPPNITCNTNWSVCGPTPTPAASTPLQGSSIDLQPGINPQAPKPITTGCKG